MKYKIGIFVLSFIACVLIFIAPFFTGVYIEKHFNEYLNNLYQQSGGIYQYEVKNYERSWFSSNLQYEVAYTSGEDIGTVSLMINHGPLALDKNGLQFNIATMYSIIKLKNSKIPLTDSMTILLKNNIFEGYGHISYTGNSAFNFLEDNLNFEIERKMTTSNMLVTIQNINLRFEHDAIQHTESGFLSFDDFNMVAGETTFAQAKDISTKYSFTLLDNIVNQSMFAISFAELSLPTVAFVKELKFLDRYEKKHGGHWEFDIALFTIPSMTDGNMSLSYDTQNIRPLFSHILDHMPNELSSQKNALEKFYNMYEFNPNDRVKVAYRNRINIFGGDVVLNGEFEDSIDSSIHLRLFDNLINMFVSNKPHYKSINYFMMDNNFAQGLKSNFGDNVFAIEQSVQNGFLISNNDKYEAYTFARNGIAFMNDHVFFLNKNDAKYLNDFIVPNNDFEKILNKYFVDSALLKHPLSLENELLIAVWQNDLEAAREAIEAGADILFEYKNVRNPLQHAALMGNSDIVEMLLVYGLNPDQKDYLGCTALHFATLTNNIALTKSLINEHRANINATDDNGITPLHLAAYQSNSKELLKMLFDHGGKIDALDQKGASALAWAIGGNNIVAAEFLLDHGADPNNTIGMQNMKQTPLNLAATMNNQAMVNLLLSKGAKSEVRDVNVSRELLKN